MAIFLKRIAVTAFIRLNITAGCACLKSGRV